MLTLVYDRLYSHKIGYPNLAQHRAEPFTPGWRQFDQYWPRVVPLRLTMYLDLFDIEYRCVSAAAGQGWYPVAFSWFDFEIDYFDLIPSQTLDRVIQGFIKILFYYHEGDNPSRIKDRLIELAHKHRIPQDRFVLVSANTSAGDWYFSEHECFFHYVNRNQDTDPAYTGSMRSKDFTLLSRQHKWWRASAVADLHRDGLLDNSIWSYDTTEPAIDHPDDNPISIYTIDGLPEYMKHFLDSGPYTCDQLNRQQNNDHHWVNTDLYVKSFFHIIVETHLDADQSGGTFLTEKTWKCIKYGQPFVLVGPAGSLQHLRDLGFCTFDRVLDNSYDDIQDPTQRWLAIKKLVAWIKQQDPQRLWLQCLADVTWNCNFFDYHVRQTVNTLAERLICHK